ncbi:hypothetical protein CRE_14946 [Caenorhabditis remanei]|uniref:F-box domain-containing protein n=1 Tax=Caenorhabditis remanei TaxID=31234 RepID=E3NBV9_CAERE|nr:hypothetical protein CRE_14946 [Caenorhabditis remanei]
MFCLKWLNTPLIDKTEKLSVNEQPEGPIMDMPDLVMRKIMENVDFITMLKLRKVCHAFRDFIDVIKLDNELTKVNIYVTPSTINVRIHFASASWKSVNFYYIRSDEENGKQLVLNEVEWNMLTSPTAKSRRVYCDHIEDADTLHNTLGHANPDYHNIYWYFKLPESDQTLQMSKKNHDYGNCFSFKWIKSSCIPKNAVVH